jgi:hypothetical protein
MEMLFFVVFLKQQCGGHANISGLLAVMSKSIGTRQ